MHKGEKTHSRDHQLGATAKQCSGAQLTADSIMKTAEARDERAANLRSRLIFSDAK